MLSQYKRVNGKGYVEAIQMTEENIAAMVANGIPAEFTSSKTQRIVFAKEAGKYRASIVSKDGTSGVPKDGWLLRDGGVYSAMGQGFSEQFERII